MYLHFNYLDKKHFKITFSEYYTFQACTTNILLEDYLNNPDLKEQYNKLINWKDYDVSKLESDMIYCASTDLMFTFKNTCSVTPSHDFIMKSLSKFFEKNKYEILEKYPFFTKDSIMSFDYFN